METTMNTVDTERKEAVFMNPILESGPDPYIHKHTDGNYYFTITKSDRIVLWKSSTITGVATANKRTIWTPPTEGPYSRNIWAPEIHDIDGKWFIYFTANDGGGDDTRRIYVLENSSPDPLVGEWIFKGAVNTELPGLDGTVLQHKNELYFLYSGYGHFPDYGSALYIAKMENPWTLTGENVLISAPTDEWEKKGGMAINEGPIFLKRNGKLFLIFSASATWSDDYCLGMLTASGTDNLMNPISWVKHPGPVFSKNEKNRVFSPGHNSFTQSPDETEDWIVYHAFSFSETEGNHKLGHLRNPRIQKIHWNQDGIPNFGTPLPAYTPMLKPSGEV
ncbi:family 43 glycosylhydrolase [Metabacillus herbersteinensis]|uniref:Family 43 glycosylhydrolase n=1 Tax=Metabacillus herbersteinensis TaxID=283816 RepID=A0ABV6G9L1_9BACI